MSGLLARNVRTTSAAARDLITRGHPAAAEQLTRDLHQDVYRQLLRRYGYERVLRHTATVAAALLAAELRGDAAC